MTTRMLIDARHPEETRVAVLKGNRIEEFDFESADRKQIKGNIYLAKVTRVEPSLQAAFVDFGGNRHGFLAFSEIHPDYYQIPKEDREALLAEEAAAAEEEAALRAEEDENGNEDGEDSGDALADDLLGDGEGVEEIDTSEKDEVATIEDGRVDNGDEAETVEDEQDHRRGRRRQGSARSRKADEVRARRMELRRRYKIQDVIQRRQVLLVQVVKEERGNKGAALTTYLSLAGRYCVLMPNSSHGGGISRKISSASDRKRLKQIVSELELPKSMGCIVRTAGLQRTKTEIKRDFDYLARLWDEIRETTLASTAPALIHSDSDLIKRAIRDIYNRDIEEVVVEGADGYRAARDFMKLLMPSHARRVKAYSDPVPLFQRYGAEDQLTAMYDPVVQLKSGGYLVINPTEALVSIDINSGRSTKEHGIEQTALNTNLEAAREIARQLRLRDMAGLVVIDFIDMEYNSNIRKVEKAVKDALKHDRARIQVGRISSFGLMEMSRQRLRTGVLEATTRSCPHCDGTGLVRTASSAGLSALRLIEDEAARGKGTIITLYASTEAAVYLLNAKRADLSEIEERYGVTVEVIPEGENEGAKMRIGSSGPRPTSLPQFEPIVEEEPDTEEPEFEADEEAGESDSDAHRKRRRRRRGGRNRKRDDFEGEGEGDGDTLDSSAEDGSDELSEHHESDGPEETDADDGGNRRKRRRRRGGRNRKREPELTEATGEQPDEAEQPALEEATDIVAEAPAAEIAQAEEGPEATAEPEAKPKRKRRSRKADEAAAETGAETGAETAVATSTEPAADAESGDIRAADTPEANAPEADAQAADAPKPKRTRRKKADTAAPAPDAGSAPVSEESAPAAETAEEAAPKPKRTRRKKAQAPAEQEPAAPVETDLPTAESAPVNEAATAEIEAAGATATDAQPADSTSEDAPRRGWWQRTFGA